MTRFVIRLAVLPFEVLIGFLAVISAGLALIHYGNIGADALTLLLPHRLVLATNVLYLAAGLGVICGVGFGRADVEIAGLIGVASGVVVRSVVLIGLAGLTSTIATSLLFNSTVLVACVVRIWTLILGDTIARVRPERHE